MFNLSASQFGSARPGMGAQMAGSGMQRPMQSQNLPAPMNSGSGMRHPMPSPTLPARMGGAPMQSRPGNLL